MSVGLELGYFTGKAVTENTFPGLGDPDLYFGDFETGAGGMFLNKVNYNGQIKNLFGACNVTLKKDVGERAFLYGGVGAGVCRSTVKDPGQMETGSGGRGTAPLLKNDFPKVSKWRFLCQAFGGLGVYLSESWSLSVGYRLRYIPGILVSSKVFATGRELRNTIKQNIIHAAEIGLTYQF